MKFLYDILPFFPFFVVYKFYGIFEATAVIIAVVIAQVAVTLLRGKRPDNMQLITLAIVVVLGSATLFFRNEMFIKWKPTVVYWLFAAAFGISQWFFQKNLVQKMLSKSLTLEDKAWSILNTTWVAFFSFMGIANLFVVYMFNTNTWVNFKIFGTLAFTLVFVLIQGILVSRFLPSQTKTKNLPNSADPL
jgi:intracellular septation protein